ncbi:MAG: hypothetical protein QM346_07950 [Chloroflexota bacterium]|nr:hypothetical protein [Chloroflexota bacterium]
MLNFTAKVAEGLEKADDDFETRRRIIDILDVRATLAIEDGKKVVYLSCRFLEDGRLLVSDTNTCAGFDRIDSAGAPGIRNTGVFVAGAAASHQPYCTAELGQCRVGAISNGALSSA